MTRMVLLALAACAAAPKPPPTNKMPAAAGAGMRTSDVFMHLGQIGTDPIVVDIYEATLDASHSSIVAPGHYDVEVVDVGGTRFELEPPPGGKLPAITGPVRATGRLFVAGDVVHLVTTEVVPLAYPEPRRLASTKELFEPGFVSGTFVEVVGERHVGFETSLLDDDVWLGSQPSTTWRCVEKSKTPRVRVRGFAYTATGHYGHMGAARAEIVATDVAGVDCE